MKIEDLGYIAETINNVLTKKNISHLKKDININITVPEKTLQQIDKECYTLFKHKEKHKIADIVQLSISGVNFILNKKEKEEH